MTEPSKANAETDLAVAEAAGIEAVIVTRGLSAFGCVCDTSTVCVRGDTPFIPTTDIAAAKEAAKGGE